MKRIAFLSTTCFLASSASQEYDFMILDPDSAFGSPYGGFSRATSSRLASMPLKLPNFGQELSEFSPFYTTMRNAEGREFACRVYHEDELETNSIGDSMFELAEPKREQEVPNDAESSSDVIQKKETDVEVVQSRTVSRFDNSLVISRRLRERLNMLKGLCAQLHEGWWSYEWCYMDKVRQFHILIEKDAEDSKSIRVQDITTLGLYKDRIIKIFNEESPDMDPSSRPEEVARNPNALGEVIDTYERGNWCPKTKKARITQTTLRCCSEEEISKNRGSVLKQGKAVDSQLLAMESIVEDPVCFYNVTLCTPLLCADYHDEKPPKNSHESQKRYLMEKGKNEKPLDAKDVGEMTVLEILKAVFPPNKCIQSGNGGWWIFELCFGRHVRQFHEVTLLDRISGMPRTEVETEHVLGKYNRDDDFVSKQDEWKFVVNTTKASSSVSNKGKSGKNSGSPSGNGAYYVQEYISGDVCDHEDVTESAVKAGEFAKGGIERATTVRYSCGTQLEMKTKEDSTCHYVVDIVIPALCGHPFFKAPVSKQQVVKCLPIT